MYYQVTRRRIRGKRRPQRHRLENLKHPEAIVASAKDLTRNLPDLNFVIKANFLDKILTRTSKKNAGNDHDVRPFCVTSYT
jgi:hypothetical protein